MKNEYKITKDLMMSWKKGFHTNGMASIILFIASCYFLIVCPMYFIEIYYIYGYYFVYIAEYLMLMIFFALFTFTSFHRIFIAPSSSYKRLYRSYAEIYGVREWLRTTEFTDDEIVLYEHRNVYRYRYQSVGKIIERGNLVTIFIKGGGGLHLYKDAFVNGSWEECKKFISEKRRKH